MRAAYLPLVEGKRPQTGSRRGCGAQARHAAQQRTASGHGHGLSHRGHARTGLGAEPFQAVAQIAVLGADVFHALNARCVHTLALLQLGIFSRQLRSLIGTPTGAGGGQVHVVGVHVHPDTGGTEALDRGPGVLGFFEFALLGQRLLFCISVLQGVAE